VVAHLVIADFASSMVRQRSGQVGTQISSSGERSLMPSASHDLEVVGVRDTGGL
jgi:hypothetical protein